MIFFIMNGKNRRVDVFMSGKGFSLKKALPVIAIA
jgi:hypothetical protein